MAAKGARYKWRNGAILHASRFYKSPSKRRLPRILIEDRAMDVGILLHIEEPWLIYEESNLPSEDIDRTNAIHLPVYFHKFQLLPAEFGGMDLYQWLKTPGNKLLVWGKDAKYYCKAYRP